LLSVGWFLNTLNVPAYFAYFGIGELRWNVIGHITIGILNICLGILLGLFYNGIGVITAWVFSLASGSSIIYLSYHVRHKIPFRELLHKDSFKLFIACIISTFIARIISDKLISEFNPITVNSVIAFLFSLIVYFQLWIHPMRKILTGWITHDLLNRK
jgi:O-antigen/teichoic acid export membrane protein